MSKKIFSALFFALALSTLGLAASKTYELLSPDGSLKLEISTDGQVSYSLSCDGLVLLSPSPLSMELSDGSSFGKGDKLRKASTRSVDQILTTQNYHKTTVRENFNELTLSYKLYDIIFRAYNEGVAYRFVAKMPDDFTVKNETAIFNLAEDWQAYVPYVSTKDLSSYEPQFLNSFEAHYSHHSVSQWESGHLGFLPMTVEADNGVLFSISDCDFLNYPGMYLIGDGTPSLKGVWAAYPKYSMDRNYPFIDTKVDEREDFIAKASKNESFPWRAVLVSKKDKDMLENDLAWLLASPKTEGDFNWVKPGKVAWDWWNALNLYGVDFETGVNNDTYKYYIDFASEHGIEYVVFDDGWYVNGSVDMMQVVPELDFPMLCKYAEERGVGLILWASCRAFAPEMEAICKHYSKMGIKGYKIDFINRDDQLAMNFLRDAAAVCAKYGQILDFHGICKPNGITRTYPNVLALEGVRGLETLKWSVKVDEVTYDVTIPFIRNVAGPMDYTPGAMKNAIKGNYKPVYTEPMSQGTRCRQLAEYVVFTSPFAMLCDSPSNYIREPECTEFIAACPVVWDETVALDGQIAEYVAVARRSGEQWHIAAMTDWTERDLTLDLSPLGLAGKTLEIFKDGVNANKVARDYAKETIIIPSDGLLTIHLAPGGGWVAVTVY